MAAYERVVRPVLYRLGDAEQAHERTLAWLTRLASRRAGLAVLRRASGGVPAGIARTVFGVRFPSPVGLAAGMDKNGVALPAWHALGFGFVEVGTVTRRAQPGNPRPRLFRLVEHDALINRMGFNNAGSDALAERLDALGKQSFPIGISIGKSKQTPIQDAVEDYAVSLRRLYRYGDYFAVNVSSPNTPGLRSLQDAGHLRELLTALHAQAVGLEETFARRGPLSVGQSAAPDAVETKPILVKIAPDLTEPAIDELLQVCIDTRVAGIIATNTTLDRSAVAGHPLAGEAGGLSGRPLAARACEVVAHINRVTGGSLPIIGVGGVLEPDDALRLFDAGASLVQIYTGLVYRGPALIRRINRSLEAS